MYKIIHIISALIRNFLLPNPYTNIIKDELLSDLFNVIIGGYIIYKLSFFLNGFIYQKGTDTPAKGSFTYLLCYIFLTLVITFLGAIISNFIIFLIVFLIIYGLSCYVAISIFN